MRTADPFGWAPERAPDIGLTQMRDAQLSLRPGIVELGWGHPDPGLLPVAQIAEAATEAMTHGGAATLSYGAERGPAELRGFLSQWLTAEGGGVITEDRVLITGGVSQALDLLCTLLTRPGDRILVASPAYHLALRIFRDHGLQIDFVPCDAEGIEISALADHLSDRRDPPPRFLYAIPTFCNPTGATWTSERRRVAVSLAAERGLTILEDDVYRALWFSEPPPPTLHYYAPEGGVILLGSFSKVLAPGLRLGWLVGSRGLVDRCAACGLLDSGGNVSYFAAQVAAAFVRAGEFAFHLERLRAAYRGRRDILLQGLESHLPNGFHWEEPGGGYFLWVELPSGCDSAALLSQAEAEGVSYIPGVRFGPPDRGAQFLRLSYSLLPGRQLRLGARRLGELLHRVAPGDEQFRTRK